MRRCVRVLALLFIAACGDVTSGLDGGTSHDASVRDASDELGFGFDASDDDAYVGPTCDGSGTDDAGDDAGWVACGGDASCNANVDYCYFAGGGPPPGVSYYDCQAFPVGCHACQCLCLPNFCGCKDTAGQIQVSCALP